MTEPAAAIVGIFEYPGRVVADRSVLQVKAYCAGKALADAGLAWSDVDGLYDAGEGGGGVALLALAEYFGVHPRVVNGTSTGGSSYEVLAGQAARDIGLGLTRVALITYASRQRSQGRPTSMPRVGLPHNNMEDPWGNTLIGSYALATRRHMYAYGTTSEQLAEIAVVARKHAVRNPEAVAGLSALGLKKTGPITVEDVVNSKMIADPLHLMDCCLVSDGGGAVVIARRDVVPGYQPAAGLDPRERGGSRLRGERRGHRRLSSRGIRAASVRRGGRPSGPGRHRDVLRLVHLHRPDRAGGPRVLQERRGRGVRLRGPPGLRLW